MKVKLMYVLVAFVAAASLGAAQGAMKVSGAVLRPQAPQTEKSTDAMLTGCVTQGSGPAVFLLDNARTNPVDQKEQGRVYLLVAASEDVSLAKHVNHEVTVTGSADAKLAPPAGQKIVEKDLPKFSAKSLSMVADKCQPASR